jgi:hypothetical protein
MVKKVVSAKKPKVPGVVVKQPRQRKRTKPMRVPGILADPRVAAWDMLLRDPCSANLAAPCYAGIDSGYLIRTSEYITPSAANSSPAGPTTVDYITQITPGDIGPASGGVASLGVSGAALPTFSNYGFNGNFICNSAIVYRFRPVACCVKWMPSGPYATRSGIVASGISPGQIHTALDAAQISTGRAACQRYAANGAEPHEVRWLPSAADENFTTTGIRSTQAACVLFAFQGVDATFTGTQLIANGSFEYTVVWEWVPGSSTGSGLISVSPKAPLPYTSQQVLGTIGDLGAYVFEGVRTAARQPGVMRAATQIGMGLLTRGVLSRGVRGPSMYLS